MAIARTRVDHKRERARERPAVLRLSTGSDQRAFGVMTKPWAAESAAARQTRRRRRAIFCGYTHAAKSQRRELKVL